MYDTRVDSDVIDKYEKVTKDMEYSKIQEKESI